MMLFALHAQAQKTPIQPLEQEMQKHLACLEGCTIPENFKWKIAANRERNHCHSRGSAIDLPVLQCRNRYIVAGGSPEQYQIKYGFTPHIDRERFQRLVNCYKKSPHLGVIFGAGPHLNVPHIGLEPCVAPSESASNYEQFTEIDHSLGQIVIESYDFKEPIGEAVRVNISLRCKDTEQRIQVDSGQYCSFLGFKYSATEKLLELKATAAENKNGVLNCNKVVQLRYDLSALCD